MVWCGVVRFGVVWYDEVWCGVEACEYQFTIWLQNLVHVDIIVTFCQYYEYKIIIIILTITIIL